MLLSLNTKWGTNLHIFYWGYKIYVEHIPSTYTHVHTQCISPSTLHVVKKKNMRELTTARSTSTWPDVLSSAEHAQQDGRSSRTTLRKIFCFGAWLCRHFLKAQFSEESTCLMSRQCDRGRCNELNEASRHGWDYRDESATDR